MKYLKNNFYIRMLIRVLKENKIYKRENIYKIDYLISKIYDESSLSLPHMIFDSLGVLQYKEKMRKMYLELIKSRYISDVIKLISENKSYSNETINYNTTKIWESINDGFLCKYLRETYDIPRSIIRNTKYNIFYKEILNERKISSSTCLPL